MRLYLVFVTAACVLFLLKLTWPKKKSISLSFCGPNNMTTLNANMDFSAFLTLLITF